MLIDLNGARVHALTGGPDFDASLPTIVFLHGAGMNATVWSLQTRWFSHHGYGVLALDLPGHGRSDGPPLATIDTIADWVAAVLAEVGAAPSALVGHSMGSLVALATAARHPAMVSRLALIGTALEMKVGPDLLAAAADDSEDAFAMVNLWGHGARAGLGGSETPGFWMTGAGHRLLEQAQPGVLSRDLQACAAFDTSTACPQVSQPVLVLQGTRDMMTPYKGAAALVAALQNAKIRPFDGAGHMLMVEQGSDVLAALANEFTRPRAKQPA